MKKFSYVLMALLMLLVLPNLSLATCNSDTDKFSSDQWCIDNEDTLIPTSSAGMRVVYEYYTDAPTTSHVLATQETGKILVDMGGKSSPGDTGVGSKHVLPRAAAGLTYTFITGVKETITIDTVDTSDQIIYSALSTADSNLYTLNYGDSIKNTGDVGDFVILMSPVANKWIVINSGTSHWSDNGTN